MRLLGLFLVVPVIALEAVRYSGGDDPQLVGVAVEIYCLTQALLQIPFRIASDLIGRKRVILFGLIVFATSSFVAAMADSLASMITGRAFQGAGAISAATAPLLADQTRDAVRTKAMPVIGGSVSVEFGGTLVPAPIPTSYVGLNGLSSMPACSCYLGWPSYCSSRPMSRTFWLGRDRITQIHAALPNTHLVMHGSSSVPQEWLEIIRKFGGDIKETYGVPVEEIQRGIRSGVRKINIDTDIRLAMTGAMRKAFAEQPSEFDPRKALIAATKAARGICKARFEAFGCAGHAAKIKPVALEDMVKRYH